MYGVRFRVAVSASQLVVRQAADTSLSPESGVEHRQTILNT